ncbi:putative AC transposase, partial [Bienertia sinuspersici]
HELKADGHVGTTNARRHTETCYAYAKFVETNLASNVVYNHDTYVRMFAESIIYHGYALIMVEHIKTKDLHHYLNPKVKDISRYTVTKYVIGEHEKYKKIIFDRLHSVSSRICLTCDGWTVCTSRAYSALTTHFIDNDWKLNALILKFHHFPPPHDGESIFQFVKSLLNEWDIEKKVFSITLDNAVANDKMVEKLRNDVHSSSPLALDGKYFHISFIDSSDVRLSAFDKAILDCGDRTSFRGKLVLDVTTKWNSTYNMIRRAFDAKEAFDLFILRKRELEMISDEEWETVENGFGLKIGTVQVKHVQNQVQVENKFVLKQVRYNTKQLELKTGPDSVGIELLQIRSKADSDVGRYRSVTQLLGGTSSCGGGNGDDQNSLSEGGVIEIAGDMGAAGSGERGGRPSIGVVGITGGEGVITSSLSGDGAVATWGRGVASSGEGGVRSSIGVDGITGVGGGIIGGRGAAGVGRGLKVFEGPLGEIVVGGGAGD